MKNSTADFILSPNCNLKCRYCFQGNPYHNQPKKCASKDTIDSFVNFCKKNKINYIDVFGGEPLYHKKQFLYLANLYFEKIENCYLGLTTNGTLIDKDIIKLIKKPTVTILLSLDGKKEHHDAMRGGFDTISKWFPILTKKKDVTIAMQAAIIPDLYENLKYIWEAGFKKSVFINIIHNYGWYDSHDLKQFEIEYEKAIRGMLAGEGQLLCAIQMISLLQNIKMPKCCGITQHCLSSDWHGNLYPCIRACELGEEFSIGDIFNGLDPKKNKNVRVRIENEAFKSKASSKFPLVSFCPVSIYQEHNCFDNEWCYEYCKMIEIKEKLVAKHYYDIVQYLNKNSGPQKNKTAR